MDCPNCKKEMKLECTPDQGPNGGTLWVAEDTGSAHEYFDGNLTYYSCLHCKTCVYVSFGI